MDFESILRHAFDVVKRHRALWVLGLIWAIVGGTGGGYGGLQYTFGGSDYSSSGGTVGGDVTSVDPAAIVAVLIPLMIAACCLLLLLIVVTTVVRYVVMVGVMRSLDNLDRFGVEPTVRGAWSEGWNARTWRPFLQNLLVGIPLAILIMISLFFVALPMLLAVTGEEAAIFAGAAGVCALFCCWMIAVIAIVTVISVLQELWWRAAVLDDLDFVSSIVAAIRLARANVGQLAMAWIVMFVVGLVWCVFSFMVAMALGLVTAFAAGLPAFLLYQITDAIVLSILVGVPIALLTFALPMAFVQGLYLVFRASVWNQVYRLLPDRSGSGLATLHAGPPVPDRAA